MDRWSTLAGLRFWLALIVAVNHLEAYADNGLLAVIPRFGAFEAILGFLLVSGYSIAESYKSRPDGYFRRRAMRVYPVYLAAVVATYVANPQPLTAAFGITLLVNVLFLNQVLTETSYVGPAWSLSLEVWLYLLAPWLAGRSVATLKRLVAASAVFFVVHTCGRTLFQWPYYAGLGWGLNLPTLGFAWLAGWLLAVHPERGQPLRIVAGLYVMHIALAVCIQVIYRLKNDALGAVAGDLVSYAMRGSTLVLVWWVMHSLDGRAWNPTAGTTSRLVRWLGDLSYPLFLLHIPAFIVMQNAGAESAWLMLFGSVVLSALAHYILESRGGLRVSLLQRPRLG